MSRENGRICTLYSVKIVQFIAIAILAIGSVATGMALYGSLVALPPALNGIDQTAGYLSSFQIPNVSGQVGTAADNLRNASSNIQGAGNNLKATADSMPCAFGCSVAGIKIIDLSQMRSNLENTATNLQGLGSNGLALAGNVDNLGNSIGSTSQSIENQVHQAGYNLYNVKAVFQFGLLSILAIAIVGVLSGAGLLLLATRMNRILLDHLSARDSQTGADSSAA
ncbi:MAG: hypothetical protein ABI361_09660 [Nitrososphaera sp.]